MHTPLFPCPVCNESMDVAGTRAIRVGNQPAVRRYRRHCGISLVTVEMIVPSRGMTRSLKRMAQAVEQKEHTVQAIKIVSELATAVEVGKG